MTPRGRARRVDADSSESVQASLQRTTKLVLPVLDCSKQIIGPDNDIIGSPKDLFGSSKDLFCSFKDLFGSSKDLFGSSKCLFCSSKDIFSYSTDILSSSQYTRSLSKDILSSSQYTRSLSKDILSVAPTWVAHVLLNVGDTNCRGGPERIAMCRSRPAVAVPASNFAFAGPGWWGTAFGPGNSICR